MPQIIAKHTSNPLVDEATNQYFPSIRQLAKALGIRRETISSGLQKNGKFTYKGHSYVLLKSGDNTEESFNTTASPCEIDKDYQEYLEEKNKVKDVRELKFETIDIRLSKHKEGSRYAIALFSDAHIEETVHPESVQFLNEYNINIAENRIKAYFSNLVSCLNRDKIDDLIFASLGDTISGYIHDELSQTNGLSPLEAVYKAQSLIFSGLKFICENNSTLKNIKFIGIVGNHSRTTKKIQHSNGYKLSYEWLMYQNIKDKCECAGLPIEFYIPESEMAIVNTSDGRKYIFIHGFQIKGQGTGTVCGIYPALNRLSMKWDRVFHQNKIYLGHFHSCVSIPNATVNGSIIGYNSYSLTNGFQCEEPAQMYEAYDTKIGELLTRKIYCK